MREKEKADGRGIETRRGLDRESHRERQRQRDRDIQSKYDSLKMAALIQTFFAQFATGL